jgi:antitoxin component HigA of HigAB toxin-antitoxin module
MNVKPLQTKAEYKTALKIVSALVDADPHRGTPEAEQLETLGALIEAYEANEIASTMQDGASHVTLSAQDYSAFAEALGGAFNPNPVLTEALSAVNE